MDNPGVFTEQELNIIDESLEGGFEGIWHIPNGENYLSIDVFDLYKHNPESFLVWEKRKLLFQGNLNECLVYIHGWL